MKDLETFEKFYICCKCEIKLVDEKKDILCNDCIDELRFKYEKKGEC